MDGKPDHGPNTPCHLFKSIRLVSDCMPGIWLQHIALSKLTDWDHGPSSPKRSRQQSAIFTRHTGMQSHMQLRLHHARDLLRRNVHSLDAAIMVGFYDQSHFITIFRKVMGTTPHYYA